MAESILYKDRTCTVTPEGVTLHGYYFPTRSKKFIPLSKIKRVVLRKLTWFGGGRGRIWGHSFFGLRWYPCDTARIHKQLALDLVLWKAVWTCSVSPENPREVYDILHEHGVSCVDTADLVG